MIAPERGDRRYNRELNIVRSSTCATYCLARSTRIQIKNRECGIVIKQTAEGLTLPVATAYKTNPPSGMNSGRSKLLR